MSILSRYAVSIDSEYLLRAISCIQQTSLTIFATVVALADGDKPSRREDTAQSSHCGDSVDLARNGSDGPKIADLVYSPDELEHALKAAQADPEAWQYLWSRTAEVSSSGAVACLRSS